MNSPWQASPEDDGPAPRGPALGWTALEMGLVVFIVMLAAWLAVEGLGRMRERRRCDRFAAELREFAAAFQSYAQRHQGAYPATARDGAVPAGLADRLQATWGRGSPFGGTYSWVASDPAGPTADAAGRSGGGTIMLTAFIPDFPLTLSRRDLLAVDAKIDDGNPATGRFRAGFNGWPVYLVGEGR